MAFFVTRLLLLCAFSTLLLVQGQTQCSHGPVCTTNSLHCKVGSVDYCCPGAFMNLRYAYGNVTSCSCQYGLGTGTSCSSTGGQGNSGFTARPSRPPIIRTTPSVFSGQNQCHQGSVCTTNSLRCKVGSVNYCCPGAYMNLRYAFGRVTSCSCQYGQGTGTSCSGTGGQGNPGSTARPSRPPVIRTTPSVFSGQNPCSHGPSCQNYPHCKVGSVNYCCPRAYMNLRYAFGRVTSCSCQYGQGTGTSCSGTGGQGNHGSTARPSRPPIIRTTPSAFSGHNQCRQGSVCQNYANCKVRSVRYCCPGAHVSLNSYNGRVKSCVCESIKNTTSNVPTCINSWSKGNSHASASGLACALASAVAVFLASR